MNENESIEFKENYTEKIYKEIIAFLNTNSGTIYIGYDDNGNLIGVDNCKDIEEKISNGMIIYENGLCFNISRSMIKEAKRLFLVRKAENV